jgi:hypothetical protein
MTTTFAQKGSVIHWHGDRVRQANVLSKVELMSPSYENMLLKSTEYATSEVTQGRNTAVRSRPRNFRFGMFRQEP